MKFIISLTSILIIESSWAHKPIVITYSENTKRALMIKDLVIHQTGIPHNLIEIKMKAKACERLSPTPLWHLCLDDLGDLIEIDIDEEFIYRGIKIFKNEVRR